MQLIFVIGWIECCNEENRNLGIGMDVGKVKVSMINLFWMVSVVGRFCEVKKVCVCGDVV